MKLKEPASRLEKLENFCKEVFGIMPSKKELLGTENDLWVSPPKVNIRLTENGYELEVDMPGFESNEIEVDVESSKLKVRAEKK